MGQNRLLVCIEEVNTMQDISILLTQEDTKRKRNKYLCLYCSEKEAMKEVKCCDCGTTIYRKRKNKNARCDECRYIHQQEILTVF